MRKKLIYLCSFIFTMTIAFGNVTSANEQKIVVFLNGELINFENQEPTIVERRTLIPLRGIFEKMGYSVGWDAKTKSCTISNSVQTITMRSGHKGMQVNDQALMLDVPAQIINNSLMIPLRAVAECTGATVTWDAPTKAIYINSNSKEQVIISPNEYVVEYAQAIAGIEDANVLFKTLNSLTDKNYNKKIETLEKESERAKNSLVEAKEKLSEMTVPEDYTEFHNTSIEAIDTAIELCKLVDSMLDDNLSYDEAKEEISKIADRANEINSKLNSATSNLNVSLFR